MLARLAALKMTPPFSMENYKAGEDALVREYFTRFEWALQLSKIPTADYQYYEYIHVHMGPELNSALQILISPRNPEDLQFNEINEVVINHFDGKRNLFAESF